jgi:hypothetical protein
LKEKEKQIKQKEIQAFSNNARKHKKWLLKRNTKKKQKSLFVLFLLIYLKTDHQKNSKEWLDYVSF